MEAKTPTAPHSSNDSSLLSYSIFFSVGWIPKKCQDGAEDATGTATRDPQSRVSVYRLDSVWRNRTEFFVGREAIVEFLTRKWNKELRLPAYQGAMGRFEGHRIASGLPMSGMTMPVIGFGLMATKTGNSTITATCGAVSPASTTCLSKNRSASIIGR